MARAVGWSRTKRQRSPVLADRLDALDRVLELGEGRLDAEHLERTRAVRDQAGERLARGDGLVVAALVGGTGSGKSSLCNAIADAAVAPVGVLRPTTEAPRAVVGGNPEAAGRLLDWLDIHHRHEGGPAVPDGLLLLDVPDHDSIARGHRATVDRLVARVDVLIWVVDPLKYAMRALHEGYLGRLASHADVVVVVLNRVDELDEADRELLVADLRRLLDAEGLAASRLLQTSARSGYGVEALRSILAEEAAARGAAARRLIGDVRAHAGELLAEVGTAPAGPLDADGVVEALAGAAGVGGVAASAAQETRGAALAGTRPIISRAGAAVVGRGPAVLRHLRALVPGAGDGEGARRAAAHAAPVAVRHAVIGVVDRAAAPLPPRWRPRLHDVVGVESGTLARALATAVDRVPLQAPARWWWPLLAGVLSFVELAALAGAIWLGVLVVLGMLAMPVPDPPLAVGPVPWPTALLLGGLAVRAIGGGLRRRLATRAALRYQRRVALTLLEAVRAVADERVLGPLRAELAAREELRRLLEAMAT